MNGSTENRAWDAPEQSARREIVLNLGTARKMLPLVSRIVTDLIDASRSLVSLAIEQDRLDRGRHGLDWVGRSRRYHVHEEVRCLEARQFSARTELEQLGVLVIEPESGRIGLPTVVNGHLAYFSWMPGDDGLRHWHFAGETVRRAIPSSWKDAGDVRLVGNKS